MLRNVKVIGSHTISGERGGISVVVAFFRLFLFFRLFFSGVSSETAWEVLISELNGAHAYGKKCLYQGG